MFFFFLTCRQFRKTKAAFCPHIPYSSLFVQKARAADSLVSQAKTLLAPSSLPPRKPTSSKTHTSKCPVNACHHLDSHALPNASAKPTPSENLTPPPHSSSPTYHLALTYETWTLKHPFLPAISTAGWTQAVPAYYSRPAATAAVFLPV